MMAITMDQARRARDRAITMARSHDWPSVGIGIGQSSGSLAVKINLASDFRGEKPKNIDGVPVVFVITGRIHAL